MEALELYHGGFIKGICSVGGCREGSQRKYQSRGWRGQECEVE